MALDQFITLRRHQVFTHHLRNQFPESHLRRPAETDFCLAGVAEQGLDLGGAEIARIDGHDAFPRFGVVALLAELDAYLTELAYLRALLAEANGPALERVFDAASRARNTWADKAFPAPPSGE